MINLLLLIVKLQLQLHVKLFQSLEILSQALEVLLMRFREIGALSHMIAVEIVNPLVKTGYLNLL